MVIGKSLGTIRKTGHSKAMKKNTNIIGRILLMMLLIVLRPSPATAAEGWGESNSIPPLQSAIQLVLKQTHTPGAGIAIVSSNETIWVTGLGKADVAANKPATADTLFRIGSVSKGFAALAALQLQEQGKLKLTDTVRQWVPDVAFKNPWESTDPLRLVHLMEHTSGFDDIHLREYALNDPSISLKDALAFGASSRVCRWPPGSRMAYCNSGPAVLAAVIEKVTGEKFEEYVQKHLFNPLHMDTASYFDTPETQQRLATLYYPNGTKPYPYWNIAYRPAGAINASAKDMANYVRFYLQRGSLDGSRIVEQASIERMETPETLPSAKMGLTAQYALYNYATPDGPFVFHGHNGAVMGGLTEMAYLPGYGRGYAVMINSGNLHTLNRIGKLLQDYVTHGLTPPPLPPVTTVPVEIQQHYAGYYQGVSPRVQMSYAIMRLLNIEHLNFDTNGRALSIRSYGVRHEQWLPMTNNLFRLKGQSAATLALIPDDHGQVLIQSSHGTYKRVSALLVWGQVFGAIFVGLLMMSSCLFALIWVPRKLLGKFANAGPLSIRIFPLVSVLSVGTTAALSLFNRNNLLILGTFSWVTLGIMISSITTAITAAASVYAVYRARTVPMNRAAYWHAVLVTAAMAAYTIYMAYWGQIGICLWAY